MKRITVVFVLLFCVLAMLSAMPSNKVIPIGSDTYSLIDSLYLLEGKAAPVGARPWTEQQAFSIVSRVEASSEYTEELKETLLSELSSEKNIVEAVVKLNTVFAYHSNTDFNNDKLWINDSLDNRILGLGGRLLLGSSFAAELELGVGYVPSGNAYSVTYLDNENKNEGGKVSVSDEQSWRYDKSFASNLYPGGFDLTLAGRSTISWGNEYAGILAGKDKLSWGNGLMGNLMLSANLPYYDFVRLTAGNNDWFRYDSQVIFFNHPMNYDKQHTDPNTGLNFFFGNRLEFRFLNDKVRLSLNEAIMYQSRDNYLDLRLLNPLQILHGLYISDLANSLASAELEIGLSKNWQLYGSFVIDDIAVPGEPQPPNDNGSTPDSWGVMGGVRSAYNLGDGILSAIFEGSYITPLTYHRRTGDYSIGSGFNDHSLDFIGSIRYFDNNRIYYQRRYLAMPFGSDFLAFKLQLEYEIPASLSSEIHLFYMAHGITDEDSEIYLFDGNEHSWGWLLTENPFDGTIGKISHTFNIGSSADWQITKHWTLSSSIDFVFIENFKNLDDNAFDFQMTVGASYSL